MVSDHKAPTGTERASYQVREPIEGDDERLATRRGDMPPLVPERVGNPKIREDRAVQDFRQNSEKMHRATSKDAYTKAWFDYCRRIFPKSVRKAGPDVDFYNVSTYQCKHPLQLHGSFNKKSDETRRDDAPTVGNRQAFCSPIIHETLDHNYTTTCQNKGSVLAQVN